MKKLFTTLSLVIVNLICYTPSIKAQIINDLSSSTDTLAQNPLQFSLQLEEISFKDPSSDYLTFKVIGPEESINLKGLQFYDDKNFKTIEEDFIVKNGTSVKLIFNSEQKDSPEQSVLFTRQKGLTATTEQIIIKKDNQYLEFFCWQKTPLSKVEQADWEKIWQEKYWEENELLSCFESEKVQTGETLIRRSNENNSSSWQIKTAQNSDNQEDSKTSKTRRSSGAATPPINNDSELPAHPSLRITEIFPAPPTGQEEWIELENLTREKIDLNGWIIDDQEGGSKPKRLSAIYLPASGFLAISLKEYKINLNNSSDQVRIFTPDGEIVAMQEYEEAEKSKSYALITSNQTETWQYSDIPTPGKRNLQLTTIRGVITNPAEFGQIYNFTIQPDAASSSLNAPILVVFEEKTIKGPLAKTTFVMGATGEFTGEFSAAPSNHNGYQKILKLESFQISNTSEKKNSPSITIIGIIVLACLGIWGVFKLYQHQYKNSNK